MSCAHVPGLYCTNCNNPSPTATPAYFVHAECAECKAKSLLLESVSQDAVKYKHEVEQYQVQLAGCLTAAEGHTQNPADRRDYGWSLAYQTTLDLRRNYDAARAEIERLKAKVENEHECAEELKGGLSKQYRESATELDALDAKLKSANLQVDALRKWITLYSECDCDVSKNKGMVHWFACRYVLGQKALGNALETKAENTSEYDGPCPDFHTRQPHLRTDGGACHRCGAAPKDTEKRHDALPVPKGFTLECPTCGEVAELTCKCFMRESRCKNGHEWHSCYVHGGMVLGMRGMAHDDTSCSCSLKG